MTKAEIAKRLKKAKTYCEDDFNGFTCVLMQAGGKRRSKKGQRVVLVTTELRDAIMKALEK